MIDAYHLPGLAPGDFDGWLTRDPADAAIRFPRLTPEGLRRQIERLGAARTRLFRTPVAGIVEAIDRVAVRFLTPGDEYRETALSSLPALTGYSPAMIRLVLDRMAADWRAPALDRLLRAELGAPGLLDGFRPRPEGGRSRAIGAALAFHLFSGNVPGVAVTSLVRSLLVKTPTLGKTASGEPLLPALFARALAEEAPALGDALAIAYWGGGDEALDPIAFGAAEIVVVYGGEEAERAARGRVGPGQRLVVHGPRVSLAIVCRGALGAAEAESTARSLATAVATFDQQGCVSPHVAYVEHGGEIDPERFAEMVGSALAELEMRLPRGGIGAADAAAIHQARGAAEFRELAGNRVRVIAPADTTYTVVYDENPAFEASCLNRFLYVKPVGKAEEAVPLVEPHGRYLQSVAVEGAGEAWDRLAEALALAGASRITTLDRLPWPPAYWRHDGGEPLRELIRWVDAE